MEEQRPASEPRQRSVFRRWVFDIPEGQDEFLAWMRHYEVDDPLTPTRRRSWPAP